MQRIGQQSDRAGGGDRQSGPSTALALRTPAALKSAPTFFPSGNVEGWKVFTIAFGAPLGALLSVVVAGELLGLGVGSYFLGCIAAPFAMFAANHMFSERGKSRLAKALSQYEAEPTRGLAALEGIVASAVLPEVRLEAAATIALARIERGDIEGAIEALSIHEQDIDHLRRRRSWETGLRGEVLRSILAWLSPGSFLDSGIALVEAFPDDPAGDEGTALLATLRALECASRGTDGPLAAAWSDIEASCLRSRLPTLHIIVQAVVAERLSYLQDELHARVHGDHTGLYRDLLRRLFPNMHILVEGGYRVISPEVDGDDTASLAVLAPLEVSQLVRLTDADMVPVSRGALKAAFVRSYGAIGALCVLATLLGAHVLATVFVTVFVMIYVGTPIALVRGSSATERAERARRIAPLARMDPPPPAEWLTECASGPPGAVTRTSGYRRLKEIPQSQLVLYAAVMKAEQALEREDHEAAWGFVEWWFSGFSGVVAKSNDTLYAAGSSLVRVAALSGHLAEAYRLLAVLAEVGNEWDGPENRTLYGNAPAAVRYAAALVYRMQLNQENTGRVLQIASEAPRVYMTARERRRIEELGRWARTPALTGA